MQSRRSFLRSAGAVTAGILAGNQALQVLDAVADWSSPDDVMAEIERQERDWAAQTAGESGDSMVNMPAGSWQRKGFNTGQFLSVMSEIAGFSSGDDNEQRILNSYHRVLVAFPLIFLGNRHTVAAQSRLRGAFSAVGGYLATSGITAMVRQKLDNLFSPSVN